MSHADALSVIINDYKIDVSIGAFDSVETYELVDIFLLWRLHHLIGLNDGWGCLMAMHKVTGRS